MSPSIEPFNEAKYKALMDGLECKEIHKSKLERTLRIDAEFYAKLFIEISEKLSFYKHEPLTACVNVSDGNHMGISDHFCEEGIPYYRGQDAGSFFIENSKPVCIDEDVFNLPVMKRSHLKQGDVLLSIVGTIGALSLVYDNKKATCSCKLAILRPNPGQSSEMLATFLRSKYGQFQIARFTRGAIQKGLILEDMDQLVVPKFGIPFVSAIEKIVRDSHQLQENSLTSYSNAEEIFQSKMTIDISSAKSISQKSMLESLGRFGRLDAEYYQEKYERYSELLHTNETVNSLCKLHDTTFLPKETESYRYIELSNVGAAGEISGVDTIIGAELPSRARRKVKAGQIVISSVEGSLQSCALVTKDLDGCLCSTGFYILDSKDINPETLLVLFKSEAIQALMKQRCSGTILTGITKDELLSMPLPKVDDKLQKTIAAKVQESFTLRRQSKQLLEYAKQAVELAIEQGEDVALAWLKANIPNLEV